MTSFVVFDNKTAKSIMQEVCQKRKLQVLWESQELQQIPPVFKTTCTIPGLVENGNNLTAEGHGSSKRDSEQIAAYKMFPKVVTTGELLCMMAADKAILQEEIRVKTTLNKTSLLKSSRTSIDSKQDDVSQLSDTDDDELGIDPVGELITLCRRNKLPLPEFGDTPPKIGAGNVPIFTIPCSVRDLSTFTGKRAKKQLAKKIAAFRVLRDLKGKGYEVEDKKSKNTSVVPPSPRHASDDDSEEVTSSQESETSRASNITIQVGHDEDAVLPAPPHSPQPVASISSPPVKRATSAVTAAEAKVDMDMETDNAEFKSKLKRKLAEEEEKLMFAPVSSSLIIKRKYELFLGFRLICENQSENCLRFIKDFAHVFQHLPPNATLEEALIPREFQLLLDRNGGALKLLVKYAQDLDAKLIFSKPLLSENPADSESESGPINPNCRTSQTLIVFLTMIFPFKDFKLNFQRKLVKIGEGKTLEEAKENAALEGLKLLRCMFISDDTEE